MKINWKLRLKNKAVLVSLIGAVLVFISSIGQSFGLDLSGLVKNAESIATAIISVLVMVGIVADPTTKGVSDSGIALDYDKPRNSENVEEHVDWVANKDIPNKLEPKTYDTSEPFSDDSDEVPTDYITGGGSSFTEIPEEERDDSKAKAIVEGDKNEDSSPDK